MIHLVPTNSMSFWRRKPNATSQSSDSSNGGSAMGVTQLNLSQSAQMLELLDSPKAPTQSFLDSANDFDRLFG